MKPFTRPTNPLRLAYLSCTSCVLLVNWARWFGRSGMNCAMPPPCLARPSSSARGGSAITTELGFMKAGGEVRVLEAQGIEPLVFLVMPRVLAMAVSAFCLTVIFVLVAFASGYGFGAFIGQANPDPSVFFNGVFRPIHPFYAV